MEWVLIQRVSKRIIFIPNRSSVCTTVTQVLFTEWTNISWSYLCFRVDLKEMGINM